MWRKQIHFLRKVSIIMCQYRLQFISGRKTSYLDSLKCHSLTQGWTMDWVTDYTLETFISACHPF